MELTIFKNQEFGPIRATSINGEPWFVGKDVAVALGYSNTNDAIQRHVDPEDRIQNDGVVFLDPIGREQRPTIVNESGVYSLIFGSKLPGAKEFKHWVTSEVLPAIRKTGGYIVGQETMSDSELIAKALIVAQRTLAERNRQLEEQKPKVLFADAVETSKSSILVGDLAKLIKQSGHDIGQNRLFQWLRDNGYLIKDGSSKNMPTQKSMDLGLFEVKERTINNPDGSIRIIRTTKVTGKGQVYFINKYAGRDRRDSD